MAVWLGGLGEEKEKNGEEKRWVQGGELVEKGKDGEVMMAVAMW